VKCGPICVSGYWQMPGENRRRTARRRFFNSPRILGLIGRNHGYVHRRERQRPDFLGRLQYYPKRSRQCLTINPACLEKRGVLVVPSCDLARPCRRAGGRCTLIWTLMARVANHRASTWHGSSVAPLGGGSDALPQPMGRCKRTCCAEIYGTCLQHKPRAFTGADTGVPLLLPNCSAFCNLGD